MKSEVLITLSISEFKDIITQGVTEVLGSHKEAEKPVSDLELLSIKQVCELLKISKVTLHKWKRQGKIPFHRLAGKVYFKKSEVLNHLKPGLSSWQI